MGIRHTGGAGDGIQTTANVFPPDGDLTIAGWYWMAATAGAVSRMLSVGEADGDPYFTLEQTATSRTLRLLTTGGTQRLISSTAIGNSNDGVTGGKWTYVAVTRTSGTWQLYMGDESTAVASEGSSSADSGWGWSYPSSATTKVFFCGTEGTSTGSWMPASRGLAYWRIWTAALSAAELDDERLYSSAGITTGLWADWDLGWTGSGVSFTDDSGSSRTLSYYTGTVDGDFTSVADPAGLSEPSGAAIVPLFMAHYRMRQA